MKDAHQTNPRIVLNRAAADARIFPGEYVHTLRQAEDGARPVLVGIEYARETILAHADRGKCELAGPSADSIGHGVVIFTDNGAVFVKTAVF